MKGLGDRRSQVRREGTTGEQFDKELEPRHWQAHVYEEMERRARAHEPDPPEHYFAEEYAERAMRGMEFSPNEYQEAAKRGEARGPASGAADVLSDAGDIAGG